MTPDPGRPATRPASRTSRLLDAGALLLIGAGVAVWLHAQRGMRELADGRMPHTRLTGAEGGWNIAEWGRLGRTANVGIALAVAGVAVGVAAFASTLFRRPPASAHADPDHS